MMAPAASISAFPGSPFEGSGGPLRGTYVLTSATGKYSHWKVGTTFSYRAIATNPPNPPGALGSVYAKYGIATTTADDQIGTDAR
jgi:hypothetical protein